MTWPCILNSRLLTGNPNLLRRCQRFLGFREKLLPPLVLIRRGLVPYCCCDCSENSYGHVGAGAHTCRNVCSRRYAPWSEHRFPHQKSMKILYFLNMRQYTCLFCTDRCYTSFYLCVCYIPVLLPSLFDLFPTLFTFFFLALCPVPLSDSTTVSSSTDDLPWDYCCLK